MEIIFYRYGSICEPDVIDAFKACGISVIEESTEIYQKSIEPESRIRILGELLLDHSVSFVFSINFFPYISEICNKLNILYVCLSVDCPVLELFSVSIRNKCNRIFLFDHMQYERFYPENPDCIFYLPLAVNTDRWDQALSLVTKEDRMRYSCDISFVGSLYKEKSFLPHLQSDDFHRGYIDGLIEAQLQVTNGNFLEECLSPDLISLFKQKSPSFYHLKDSFTDTDSYVAANYFLGMEASARDRIRTLKAVGKDFSLDLYTRSDISDFKGFPDIHCHGGISTHHEMPLVFYFSKINLNITIKSIQSGISQRIWDVLGCRGFLLSNYQNEIPAYFEIGRDLDCYENLSDLKEKIRFYLDHDDIRREIAEQGYQTVKAHHTYLHRLCRIMEILFPSLT